MLELAAPEDVIIRGNINVSGQRSDLRIRSDKWVYFEGSALVQDNIEILAGSISAGASTSGANSRGTSVYVH